MSCVDTWSNLEKLRIYVPMVLPLETFGVVCLIGHCPMTHFVIGSYSSELLLMLPAETVFL